MRLFGRRVSFVLGLLGVGLRFLQEPAQAQYQACAALFKSYSKTEIVDALVTVRDTRRTIAGSPKTPAMLGKADTRYINAVTVCRDITLASELEDELRKRRNARDDLERWRVEYRQQMLAQIAEVPAARPEGVDPQKITPARQ